MAVAEADFSFIADLVKREAAIVLEPGKEYLVETRLAPIVREFGFQTLPEFLNAFRAGRLKEALRPVIEALTTNETSFFRDLEPFDALRTIILPELIQRRAKERKLTIWSAACSTGQEAYSIAMLIRDNFPELEQWNVRILGTDLNLKVLEKAKSGTFSQLEINRGLPAKYLIKFFDKSDAQWILKPSIRTLVEFRQLNLMKSFVGIEKQDVVFLRNVLIYFDIQTKRSILQEVQRVMHPDSTLFLGAAETTLNLNAKFQRRPLGKMSCYFLEETGAIR